jgi:hypothetical protein
MASVIIKIPSSAFGAGQPLEGTPPEKARIPIGHGIQGSGSFMIGKELRNIGYRNPAAAIATVTGYEVPSEEAINKAPFDGFRAPLATLVFRGIVAVAKAIAGTGDSLTLAGATITFVDAAANFPASMVGQPISIEGATNPGNNGVFIIVSRVGPTSLTWINVSGVTEIIAFTWAAGEPVGGKAILDGTV